MKIFLHIQHGPDLHRFTPDIAATYVIRMPLLVVIHEISEPVVHFARLSTEFCDIFKNKHSEQMKPLDQ